MAFETLKSSIGKILGAPEQKSAPAAPELWGLDAFLSPNTLSNVAVTPQTAMRVPAVSTAVNLIAQSCGMIPARMTRTVDGEKILADDHPAHRLVARSANDRMTAGKLRERLAMDALFHGNAFAFANRVGGRVVEIIRLDPHAVGIHLDPTTGEPTFRSNVERRVFDPRDLIHIPAPVTFDGWTGVSPIALAREAIALAITMEARAARLFGVSARPAGVIRIPADVGEESVRRMGANWRAAHEGGENSGKTPILTDGADFLQLTFSSVDAQFLEMRREQVVEIARAFGVPATMLFELSRGTYRNTEEQARQFITYTLAPWLQTFAGELDRALLTDEERETYAVEFDTDALVAIDTAARTDRIAKLRSAGVLTANDARRELGLEAHDDGDQLTSPHTTAGTTSSSSSADDSTPTTTDEAIA